MITVLWAAVPLVTIAFAYVNCFSGATLSFGRELANDETGTGVQDAITPPWEANFALVIYAVFFATVSAMWWFAGWQPGVGAIALIFFGAGIVSFALPNKDSPHFRHLIIQSMISRYADYVRDGDTMRAQAMKELTIKAGVNPDMSESPVP